MLKITSFKSWVVGHQIAIADIVEQITDLEVVKRAQLQMCYFIVPYVHACLSLLYIFANLLLRATLFTIVHLVSIPGRFCPQVLYLILGFTYIICIIYLHVYKSYCSRLFFANTWQ